MLLDEQSEIEALTQALIEQEPDGRLLMAEIDIGEDAAQFLKSQLGRYIVGRVNAEIAEIDAKLRSTFPLRWKRMMQLQNEIAMREKIKIYLLESIQSGRSALAELSRRQGEIEHG